MYFLARTLGIAAAYATDPAFWLSVAVALFLTLGLRHWWWPLLLFPLAVFAYRIGVDFLLVWQGFPSGPMTLPRLAACVLLGLVLALLLLLVRCLGRLASRGNGHR